MYLREGISRPSCEDSYDWRMRTLKIGRLTGPIRGSRFRGQVSVHVPGRCPIIRPVESASLYCWEKRVFPLALVEVVADGKRVPDDLKTDPSLIAYWPTPNKILKQNTKSHVFLEFIHAWLYNDISAEAHLKPSGLLAAGTFLCKDHFSEGFKRQIEEREFHKYKARLFCRKLVVLLGAISEIEMFRNFPNREQVAKI
jgi:hypothetical protein